jgi:hypothetical protein
MRSQVVYKGTLYRQAAEEKVKENRRVEKGIFHDINKAWEWAELKLKGGFSVFVDAVGGKEDEFILYASKNPGNVVKFHMQGGEGRGYKDLLEVKSKKDLEGIS